LRDDLIQLQLKNAQSAFADIFSSFPLLKVTENPDEPVEISYTLSVQEGLRYKVELSLQNNDEVYFSTEDFVCSWFPVSDKQTVSNYVNAVSGFLSGNYRILKQYRGNKCIKSELQQPDGDGWKTIATSSHLRLSFSRTITFKEIHNK
jgi:hypothetical protein